jgi:DNA mismatch repair protein MSH5
MLNHVIVALDMMSKGTVGCAYYIAREERLLCLEDIPRGDFDSMDRRLFLQYYIRSMGN